MAYRAAREETVAGRRNRPRHAKRSPEAESTSAENTWVTQLKAELDAEAESQREPVPQLPEILSRANARKPPVRGRHRKP